MCRQQVKSNAEGGNEISTRQDRYLHQKIDTNKEKTLEIKENTSELVGLGRKREKEEKERKTNQTLFFYRATEQEER